MVGHLNILMLTENGKKKSMINLVQQRYEYDCVIASAAMWLNKPYEEIADMLQKLGYERNPDSRQGVSSIEQYKMLRKFGMHPITIDTAFGGVPGILSLPSLNVPGGAHACFYDGKDIYDPQTGREEKKHYPLQIENYWPSCYKITIDLKDNCSREMAEIWLQNKRGIIERATKEIQGEQPKPSVGSSRQGDL